MSSTDFFPGTYTRDGRYKYNGQPMRSDIDRSVKLLSDANFRLYSGKIKLLNADYLDLVPCYRKSDGVAGLYDLVNDTFYTNQGSGDFKKGPPVNIPYNKITNIYIGDSS